MHLVNCLKTVLQTANINAKILFRLKKNIVQHKAKILFRKRQEVIVHTLYYINDKYICLLNN